MNSPQSNRLVKVVLKVILADSFTLEELNRTIEGWNNNGNPYRTIEEWLY